MESSTPTTARPRRGAELELRIDSLAYGGAGVARTDGYVVFVRDAVPGDRVRAVVTKSKRQYAEGHAVELLEPSPDRVAPRAHHPGAPWQVLPYERQLEVKAEQVADALLDRAAPDAIALHCLPAHPGEEITEGVLYGDRQRIWDQAENRRHVFKALLEFLVAG